MSPDKLVHMANQIATFFASQPGNDQVDRIAAHLKDFWDPSMIRALQAHVAAGGEGLNDRALAAATLLRPVPADT
jgi:formate dehydrogenase subunit delta